MFFSAPGAFWTQTRGLLQTSSWWQCGPRPRPAALGGAAAEAVLCAPRSGPASSRSAASQPGLLSPPPPELRLPRERHAHRGLLPGGGRGGSCSASILLRERRPHGQRGLAWAPSAQGTGAPTGDRAWLGRDPPGLQRHEPVHTGDRVGPSTGPRAPLCCAHLWGRCPGPSGTATRRARSSWTEETRHESRESEVLGGQSRGVRGALPSRVAQSRQPEGEAGAAGAGGTEG